MMLRELRELPEQWRAKARELERYAPAAAIAFEDAAAALEAALEAADAETLNLEQAARESGYSADYLGVLVREGKIPNAGRPNAPRIRRADLPRKATAKRPEVAERANGSPSLDAIVRRASRSRR